jgi:hypothetical protein
MICVKCIYDENVAGISFDSRGVCNYCHQVSELMQQYGTGSERGIKTFENLVSTIKKKQRFKKYDCVVGVSGGTDSSYVLLRAVQMGLRPLAVHYDNTWNSAIATQNIATVTKKLNVDLLTFVVGNKEVDDIKLAFLKSGVPEFDADTDLAFVQVIRNAAAKAKTKYIFEGHSFVTEGVSPVGGNYLDGGYISDVWRRYGKLKKSSYPLMGFWVFLKWAIVYRQKFIRPLWYLDYDKENAREILQRELGWKYYGGHHLENKASTFAHTVWLPQKFGIDYRNLVLAASVRRGVLDRNDALEVYQRPVVPDKNLIKYVKKRLELSDDEFEKLMNGPKRSWMDFKNYKKRFELMRPIFYVLAKFNLIPMSFYIKYCFPIRATK